MKLSAGRTLRLYEALGNVADSVPPMMRRALVQVWWARALGPKESEWHRKARGQLFRDMPELVRDDFVWILRTLPDAGAADVLRRWATDAGHTRVVST